MTNRIPVGRAARAGVALSLLAGTAGSLLLPVPARAGNATAPACTAAVPGGDWPSYGHDASNTRNQEAEHTISPSVAAGLSPAWVFSTAGQGDNGAFDSTPVEQGGCVYVASTSGVVYALDDQSGKLLWSTPLRVATQAGLGGAIVGAPAVEGPELVVLVNQVGDGGANGPYAVALDRTTGHVIWQSPPITTATGFYSNASPEIFNGLVFAGFSPPEGQTGAQGGFALLSASTGAIQDVTTTVSAADQAQGYAGGGIWSTPAFDPSSGYAFVGSGNPYSKTKEDPRTNAILKVDLNPLDPAFGQIVASYKGNVDQYAQTLQALSQTPACDETADQNVGVDNPVCGQLDLDFGAATNLFRDGSGRLIVGELQKSGVYHAAYAGDMSPDWSTIAGLSCSLCNAASPATDGASVYPEGTPGGVLWSLDQTTGTPRWASPVLDGAHYQSISMADGVVYTLDGNGFFDAYSASTGSPLLHRPLAADTGASMVNLTSAGVAVADDTVFVAASGGAGAVVGGFAGQGTPDPGGSGYLIAYRPGGTPLP